MSRLLLVLTSEKVRVNWDERSRESPFAKNVLKKIRNSKGRCERIGGERIAKVISKHALPNNADDAADQDSGADHERMSAGAFTAGWIGGSRARKLARRFADYIDCFAGDFRRDAIVM